MVAKRRIFPVLAALALSVAPFVPATAAHAGAAWQVNMGAETKSQGIQLAYFFPGDITVNKGDTITWNFATGEPHSVVFADAGGGVPVSSGEPSPSGTPPFNLTFNTVGDFPYACGLHLTMKGTVHVQAAGSAYPKDQKAYDEQSKEQQDQLFEEGRALLQQGKADAKQAGQNQITTGIGALHDTGAIFVMRFIRQKLTVKVGDTVTWTNRDPEAPHTITMNLDNFDPTTAIGLDSGTNLPGHATVGSSTQQVNSGFLWNPSVASMFLPPFLQRGTVFQITFTQPGTYKFYCDLHDVLGMTGTIKVTPKDSED